MNAYVEKDLELSRAVIEYDDVVDEMFEENKKQTDQLHFQEWRRRWKGSH